MEHVRPVTTVDGSEQVCWSAERPCSFSRSLVCHLSRWQAKKTPKSLFCDILKWVFQVFLFCRSCLIFDFSYMIMGELFALNYEQNSNSVFLPAQYAVWLPAYAPSDKIHCWSALQAALVPFSSAKAPNMQGPLLSKLSLPPGSLHPHPPIITHCTGASPSCTITYLGAGYRVGWGKGKELATTEIIERRGEWEKISMYDFPGSSFFARIPP